MMKKFLALLLAICCVCTSLIGCVGDGNTGTGSGDGTGGGSTVGVYNNATNKENKVVISIRNTGGGTGRKWLDLAAETFAKDNAETQFANGKKGVYIEVDNTMGFEMDTLASTTYDVVVGGGFIFQQASKGLLLNLDSIVKDTSREGGSIESNLIEQAAQSAIYEGSYYGIPFFEYYPGLSYNHEVFQRRGYFISDSTEGTVAFDSKFSSSVTYFTNDVNKKSVGSDGVKGTEDDGLPVSLEQLLVLMEKIEKDKQYAPVMLGGAVSNYSQYFAMGLMASLAGKTQMTNMMNSSGVVDVVVREGSGDSIEYEPGQTIFSGTDIKKPRTTPLELNATNGAKGGDLVARYYANAAVEIMLDEGFFSTDVTNEEFSHLNAQSALLAGKGAVAAREKPAMLIEASYWMNEARENNLGVGVKQALGKDLEEVDVRVMPLPTCIYTADATTQSSAFVSTGSSYLVVNKNIEGDLVKKDVVLDFLAFLNTEKQLQEYTIVSGMARSMNYSLPEADSDGVIRINCIDGKTYAFSSYYQHLWNARKQDGSNVIYSGSTSESFRKNATWYNFTLTKSPLFKNNYGDRPNPYVVVSRAGTEKAFTDGSITGWVA